MNRADVERAGRGDAAPQGTYTETHPNQQTLYTHFDDSPLLHFSEARDLLSEAGIRNVAELTELAKAKFIPTKRLTDDGPLMVRKSVIDEIISAGKMPSVKKLTKAQRDDAEKRAAIKATLENNDADLFDGIMGDDEDYDEDNLDLDLNEDDVQPAQRKMVRELCELVESLRPVTLQNGVRTMPPAVLIEQVCNFADELKAEVA